jgi:2',3'-cyclic-nucleotide 2'-phosphodiesterase/3'-nucleotidase
MEWSAGYFNQLHDGDVTYSFNPQRRASNIPPTISSTV